MLKTACAARSMHIAPPALAAEPGSRGCQGHNSIHQEGEAEA